MIIGWLLRIILIIVIVRALWRLFVGVFEGLNPQVRSPEPQGVALVQDPVCGTYVVPTRALTTGSGAGARYFCSERCRDSYLKRVSA